MVNEKESRIPFYYFLAGITGLLAGTFFGVFGSLQQAFPDYFWSLFPFYKSRPLHVTFVIAWIFFAAMGSIYYFLPRVLGKKLYSDKLAMAQFFLMFGSGVAIFISYLCGKFSGREYLDFLPVFSVPILAGWVLFIINFFATLRSPSVPPVPFRDRPVYLWMWATGLILFFYTFCEAHLWLIPYFRNNIVRDVSVQWKAYGALIGSWNMMVYGLSFVLMEKIQGKPGLARKPEIGRAHV